MRSAFLALAVGALVAPFPAAAQIYNYWGVGAIRSGFTTGQSTSTSQEQSSTVKQVYGGATYSATGENINASGPLGPDTSYTIARPGEPFQFSTTNQSAGLTSIESGSRTVTTQTTTNSLSVFSEIQ